ncbi:MAG: hypothetical protein EXR94_06305 [Gemmatimonadetes bacterium]|nr:hypothetical protein [Gemmatimonadota bacterium]
MTPVGRSGELSIHGWHYLRVNGDSSRVVAVNRERITSIGTRLGVPLRAGVDLNLGLDGRMAKMGPAPGRAVGAEAGLGLSLGRRARLFPSVRYDIGSLDEGVNQRDIRGFSMTVFVRSK